MGEDIDVFEKSEEILSNELYQWATLWVHEVRETADGVTVRFQLLNGDQFIIRRRSAVLAMSAAYDKWCSGVIADAFQDVT